MRNKSISGIIPILILLLIPLIIYSISLTFGFVFDDNPQILENPWITDLSHISDIFSTSATAFMGRTSNTYRPLVFIAFIVEHYVFGFKAWGFHLVNVLLHSLNTVMVFLVASFLFSKDAVRAKVSSEPSLKTSPIPAFFAALVFARTASFEKRKEATKKTITVLREWRSTFTRWNPHALKPKT